MRITSGIVKIDGHAFELWSILPTFHLKAGILLPFTSNSSGADTWYPLRAGAEQLHDKIPHTQLSQEKFAGFFEDHIDPCREELHSGYIELKLGERQLNSARDPLKLIYPQVLYVRTLHPNAKGNPPRYGRVRGPSILFLHITPIDRTEKANDEGEGIVSLRDRSPDVSTNLLRIGGLLGNGIRHRAQRTTWETFNPRCGMKDTSLQNLWGLRLRSRNLLLVFASEIPTKSMLASQRH
ncbi:hypothetical protein C8R43DRAFT_952239 [Mycena crocata]|nr:hypothetical protein C8R43DRAFT_952239 [Mycena crocata]